VGKRFAFVCYIGAAPVGNSAYIVIYQAVFIIYAAESVCKFTEYLFNMHFSELLLRTISFDVVCLVNIVFQSKTVLVAICC